MNGAAKSANSSSNESVYRSISIRHCGSAFQKIRNLQQRGKFCDVTVRVAGKEYFAHKVILAAVSLYFADLLDVEENQPDVIDFNDTSSAVFEMLLEYAYTGHVVITSENVGDLFAASKILRMGTLEAACFEALPVVLTGSNWYKLKAIASEHHSEEVYEKCQAYALQHFTDIADTDVFLELPLDEVKKLVAGRGVVVLSEEEMYSAMLKWVKHDLENRRQNLFELIKDVKFPLMDKSFLTNTVIRENLLGSDIDCTNLLLQTTGIVHAGNQSASSGTVPRQHLKSTLASYMFAIGGYSCGGSSINECEMYNPRTNMWHPIASMQTERGDHAVIGYGQHLYAFGGSSDDEGILSSVEYYNPIKDAWAWTTPLPHERMEHGICALNDSIFICGGRSENDIHISTVDQFDPSTALYTKCAAMNTERTRVKMAATGDCIYAIGGQNPEPLDSMERFDPREGRWYSAPSMRTRKTHWGLTVLNGYIYCTGGVPDNSSGERFDIRRNKWEPIPNMLSKRWSHELVALDGCVYAIGGYNSMQSVEKFDPDTSQWVEMSSMLDTRAYFAASALDCVEINHLQN